MRSPVISIKTALMEGKKTSNFFFVSHLLPNK